MPRKKQPKTTGEQGIYPTLFALVAREGWWTLTLPKIARAAKIPLAELLKTAPDKNALLAGFAAQLDQKLAQAELEEGDTLKERLFEVIMRRFELMQPYRAGFSRLMEDLIRNPAGALCLGLELSPVARRSLRLVLELAEFPVARRMIEPAILGLKLVMLYTFRTWKDDASADLSPTMAALDRALDRYLSFLRLS
ncbi:MAG: hypothetical protein HY053_00090 [Proteobacteria bacterium]|nr:hypothetical protein [Pseudomonadota bacterium]